MDGMNSRTTYSPQTNNSHYKMKEDSSHAKSLIKFNFCPLPLHKNNVIKINLEVSNNSSFKDILIKAIGLYNQANESLKIHNKTEKYKIKLSKKSGLPDMDLPSLNETMKLSETDCLSFSTTIDDEHVLIMPKKTFNPNDSALHSKNTHLQESFANNFNLKTNLNSEAQTPKVKKGNSSCCCCRFLSIWFKK